MIYKQYSGWVNFLFTQPLTKGVCLMTVKPLQKKDIADVAGIASQHFGGMNKIEESVEWVCCNFRAFPRMQYFVAKEREKIIGYILWVEKGGFRRNAVFELEQLAVLKEKQGNGIGTLLIEQSLEEIKVFLQERGSKLRLVKVTTGAENKAQHLYKKSLGAVPAAVLVDFFHGDEVIMIARFK